MKVGGLELDWPIRRERVIFWSVGLFTVLFVLFVTLAGG
jgi:hypothetical protein